MALDVVEESGTSILLARAKHRAQLVNRIDLNFDVVHLTIAAKDVDKAPEIVIVHGASLSEVSFLTSQEPSRPN
jgi:hypothetical protein